ncbi:hypothetical protein ABIE65_002303 [Constrictibacter sp. MBR-5]
MEADETYYGKQTDPKPSAHRRGAPYLKKNVAANKRAVISLVESGGRVHSFRVAVADKFTVNKIVRATIDRESRLHTDESRLYGDAPSIFSTHGTVKHSVKENVRGDVHTNSAEGFFSIFKRGMKGIYQHCSEKHLHRCLAEYDFRYNHRVKLGFDDPKRTAEAIRGASGKRLTYMQSGLSQLPA